MILLLSHIFCSIFAVLLRSTDEEVGRLVGEVKKKFEEKYHSCEAFREERLTGEKAKHTVKEYSFGTRGPMALTVT